MEWRDANPHTDKKEFTNYWKTLPEDQKEVFWTLPLSFILSDALNSIRHIIHSRKNSCVNVSFASDYDIDRPRLLDFKIVLDVARGYRGRVGTGNGGRPAASIAYPRGSFCGIEDTRYGRTCIVLP